MLNEIEQSVEAGFDAIWAMRNEIDQRIGKIDQRIGQAIRCLNNMSLEHPDDIAEAERAIELLEDLV